MRLSPATTAPAESNVTYYLPFSWPSTAEEPLARIAACLSEGRDPMLGLWLDETFALESDHYNRGSETVAGRDCTNS